MNRVRLEDLLPLMEEAFSRGAEFRIPVTGTSMMPLLNQGRDFVVLKKPDSPAVGDIPLYRRSDGQFVLHRIVGKKDGAFICRGDNQYENEDGVLNESIIGVVTKIERGGRVIRTDEFKYNIYVRVWSLLLPVRRARKRRNEKSVPPEKPDGARGGKKK